MLEACDYFVQATIDSSPISMQAKTIEAVEVAADSFLSETYIPSPLFIGETEAKIIEAGLIDIKTIDTTIKVDLKYSTKNNFLGIDVYGDFNKCYLQPDVAEKLNLKEGFYSTSFQSRLGRDPWLQPYTDQTIDDFAKNGINNLAVVTPAFVSDCLETLEEIGMEAKHSFKENGGIDFSTIPCLNDDDAWVKTLARWINNFAKV